MKKYFFIAILLFFTSYVHAFQAVDINPEFQPTQEELLGLAIEKDFVPADHGEEYFREKIKEKDTLLAWVGLSQEDKIKILGALIEIHRQEGTIVERHPVYYAKEIDKTLYIGLRKGTFREMGGIGIVFKTIAVMDGDFDNGEDPKVLLESWMPVEVIEVFKQTYPKKYKRIFGE
ncbi:MAG: hypothetical protein PHY73_05460 [Candidatus Omnitrophica bacterium]|nr:hypothetical protein [Candidatus Omnitrophota bacterium]